MENKRLRVYQFLVAALIVLNITLILLPRFFPPHPKRPDEILRRELSLTDEQMQQYRQLIDQHRTVAGPLEHEIGELRRQLFDYDEVNDVVKQELNRRLAEKEADLSWSLYQHFKEVRKICTPAQREKFDDVLLRALHAGRPPGPRP